MSDLDNIDSMFASQTVKRKEEFNVNDWSDKKNQKRTEAYSTIDRMTDEVVNDENKFKQYLDLQSKFDTLSSNNILLLLAQKPDATNIIDASKKPKNVYVKKNEKSFTILVADGEYQRDDGSVGVNYDARSYFDISQLKMRSIPPKVPTVKNAIFSLINYSPINIKLSDDIDKPFAYNESKDTLYLNRNMKLENMVVYLSNEIAHAEMSQNSPNYKRENSEFHANCVAYLFCKRFDIDTNNYKFDFSDVPDMYKDLDTQDIKADLSKISNTYKAMGNRCRQNLFHLENKNKSNPER